MAIMRVRGGETLRDAWSSVTRRASLGGDPARRRSGDTLPLTKLVALRRPFEISPVLRAELDIIEWIDLGGGREIMKGEVTVRLFKLMTEGYEIAGNNADKLKSILTDPAQEERALTYVSFSDGIILCEALTLLTGTEFAIQAKADWEAVQSQLSGGNLTWTKTSAAGKIRASVLYLCARHQDHFSTGNPSTRDRHYALRLVRDKHANRPTS